MIPDPGPEEPRIRALADRLEAETFAAEAYLATRKAAAQVFRAIGTPHDFHDLWMDDIRDAALDMADEVLGEEDH